VRWSARIFSWSENGGKTILALFEWWNAVICGKKPTICTLTLWWYSHSIVYALLLANNCEVMFISSASLGWQSKSQGRVWMIASPADHFQSATFCANISGKVKKKQILSSMRNKWRIIIHSLTSKQSLCRQNLPTDANYGEEASEIRPCNSLPDSWRIFCKS